MLYDTHEAFLAASAKRITLMGMSNVGKTRLASLLPSARWFHFSVDYRLATAHLREEIVDTLKLEMMKSPLLAAHLREEAIHVDLNVTFSNLAVVSRYLGMVGDPAFGGLNLKEFMVRQARHRQAEIRAVCDSAEFIGKAKAIYGYDHFVCDASGSLCELIGPDDDADPVLAAVCENSLLVYIEADDVHEARLIENARRHPKPLYYRPEFLAQAIADYLAETGLATPEQMSPKRFAEWVYPRLLAARRPRYSAIARHGCVVSAHDVTSVKGEDDFVDLIGQAIERKAAAISARLVS